MITDPIADMLIRIKNAYMAGHHRLTMPHSKLKANLAQILLRQGFIKAVSTKKEDNLNMLVVTLKYSNSEPAITMVNRISKPGRRVYVKKNEIPKVLGGLGTAIISTPSGLLTDQEARKKGAGGELLCTIW